MKLTARCGKLRRLEIDLRRYLFPPCFRTTYVLLVVDDRTFWSDKLIAEEQGLQPLLGLDLEEAALGTAPGPGSGVGDLTDDSHFDPLMPADRALPGCS